MQSIILILVCISLPFQFTNSVSGINHQDQDAHWIAPESAKSISNPLAGDKESASMGKGLYRQRCSSCHGKTGKGDGPGGAALDPKPADHSSAIVQDQTDGELFWKISEGRGAMTGYAAVLDEEERWDLVNFIRTLDSSN
jgi:mono/diheme cytochrome c family protein